MRARLLASILIGLFVASPAAGQRPSAAPDEVARLQAEHRQEQLRARRLRADAEEAADEIARLDRELRRLDLEESRDTAVVAAQRARLQALGRREGAILEDLSAERARQARLFSALQMMSRRPPPPLLIPADRAVDTVRAAILMKAMAPDMQARAQALAERQAEVQRIRRRAALASEALFTTESSQANRRAEAETLRARRQTLLSVLRADAARAEAATEALESRLRDLGAGPAPSVPGAERAAPSLAQPAGRARLTAPLPGPPRVRYTAESRGWSWRADGGAAVRAPAEGSVAYVGVMDGWGGVAILDLGPGWRVVLAGLDSFDVQEGDRVADGAVVGRLAQGPDADLHFELRREGRPVDPSRWLED